MGQGRRRGKPLALNSVQYVSLLGPEGHWRKPALLGMLLCISGVIGLWGIGFFAPELVSDVISSSLRAKGISENEITKERVPSRASTASSKTSVLFLACWLSPIWHNVPVVGLPFVIAFIGAFIATNAYFQLFKSVDQLWMSGVMGFFQLALFAGFAIYLPELFPTRLRSTVVFAITSDASWPPPAPLHWGSCKKALAMQP